MWNQWNAAYMGFPIMCLRLTFKEVKSELMHDCAVKR